jgi:nitronate monooxygenase
MVSNWPDTRFAELAGTEHPIIQAPMANAGGVELCVGAIEGGALGSLPCGMLSPAQIREQVAAVRRQTNGPLNLNFFCHRLPDPADDSSWRSLLRLYYNHFRLQPTAPAPMRMPFDEEACAVVEELRPAAVSFHFGLPDEPLLKRAKTSGAIILSTATTVREARHLEDRGVDAVIAQGFEAGGHNGRFLGADPAEALTLLALLPQVAAAVSVPLIAAGAIADGRGIAAAFALGASAVQVGTAFLHCPESLVAAEQREMLRQRPTVMTNLYSGGLARAMRGRLVDELGPIREEAPPYPLAGAASMPLFRASQQHGEHDFMPILAGQGGPLGRSLPAADLTRQLAAEAVAILDRRS